MMTVRFPNGQAVQYNDANYVSRYTEFSDLYTKKDGKWIAQIPNNCIIEVIPACKVYNALDQITIESNINIQKEIRSTKRLISKLIKK